jgi:hypothetical protein
MARRPAKSPRRGVHATRWRTEQDRQAIVDRRRALLARLDALPQRPAPPPGWATPPGPGLPPLPGDELADVDASIERLRDRPAD